MKKLIVLILLLLTTVSKTQASVQSPDKVLFEGYEYSLHFYPLEKYFAEHPNRKPKAELFSFNLHRGYKATFEVKDNLLSLHDLTMSRMLINKPYHSESKSVKHEMFKNNQSTVLDWFSGILVLPYGEMVNYSFGSRHSIYTHYLLLEIKNGQLTEKRRYDLLDYELFKDKQFQAFKKNEDYKDRVLEIEPWMKDSEDLDDHIHRFIPYFSKEFLVKQ